AAERVHGAEVDLPPRLRIVFGVGDGAGGPVAVGVAVDRARGCTAPVGGARLRRRLADGQIALGDLLRGGERVRRSAVDLDLGEREIVGAGELDLHVAGSAVKRHLQTGGGGLRVVDTVPVGAVLRDADVEVGQALGAGVGPVVQHDLIDLAYG